MSRIEATIVAEEVYRRIKRLIIEGKLPQGSRIDKKNLAVEFGVSLTPVNEASARLLGERFLERRSGAGRESDGLFVPERPDEELVNVFSIRAGIEGIAARLCVERALTGADPELFDSLCWSFSKYADKQASSPFDPSEREAYLAEDKRFHETIIRYAGNPIIEDLDVNLGCMHRSYIRGLIRPPEITLPEHREIIAAFKARDPDLAQELVIRHHLRSRDMLKAQLERNRLMGSAS